MSHPTPNIPHMGCLPPRMIYLSLTLTTQGHTHTLPLTPWLLILWLMAAFPLIAQLAESITRWADVTLTLITSALLTLIMAQILLKAVVYGIRSKE